MLNCAIINAGMGEVDVSPSTSHDDTIYIGDCYRV